MEGKSQMNDTAATYNHLKDEKSPYLQQHSRQPVDWYPWGEAAFEKARRENKPLLISIGYSTCHWCHVMAEESFDDPEVAAIMNRLLVNVKIDREERPDIDQIYISAVSAMTGSAGWPLNVFITPEGKPFYGGTYFPPRKRVSPAWREIVAAIGSAWRDPEKQEQLFESADRVTNLLRTHLGGEAAGIRAQYRPDPELLDHAVETIASLYDSENGGFSNAPKFPMPAMVSFLLFYRRFGRHAGRNAEMVEKAAGMAEKTLEKMADGGIYDHLGGGFHRYSTDARWHVPHFEKMLYDNAQLISVYLDAFQAFGNRRFARVAEESLAYILRDMTHPDGGFYSAEDADSIYRDLSGVSPESDTGDGEKSEGGYFVWRMDEIRYLLDRNTADIFAYHFDVRENGNVLSDPMEEFTGKNVLYRAHTVPETARHFDRSETNMERLLKTAGRDLFVARLNRPRPHLDDKILTEWNGLMISALAKAARVLEKSHYLTAAEAAVHFIHDRLYDRGEPPVLYRRWRDGERKVSGMAAVYAFLVQGLLDVYEAGFDPWMFGWAVELNDILIERFFDSEIGGFYATHDGQDSNLLFHVMDATDSVLPSAASVAARNCIRLHRWTGNDRYLRVAEQTFSAARERVRNQPASVPEMLVSEGTLLLRSAEVVIAGSRESAESRALLEAVRWFPPETVQLTLIGNETDRDRLAGRMPHIRNMEVGRKGEVAAYVCYDQACREPVSDPDGLDRLLREAFDPPLRQ